MKGGNNDGVHAWLRASLARSVGRQSHSSGIGKLKADGEFLRLEDGRTGCVPFSRSQSCLKVETER